MTEIYLLERLNFNEGWPDQTPEGSDGKPIEPYFYTWTEMYRYNDNGTHNFILRDFQLGDNPLVMGEIEYLLRFQKEDEDFILSKENIFKKFGLERKKNFQGDFELYRALPQNSAEAKRLLEKGVKIIF